ncbi:hypothetical protein I4U23_026895 [Adineta vaga]|nr:hypothetical protein I4U23_026895 [Adineta vaga]
MKSLFDSEINDETIGAHLSFNTKYPLQYEQLPSKNELYMKQVIYTHGPIYFSFNCGKREVSTKFDHYSSGIFDVLDCPTHRNMNYVLIIVGYGTENDIDY